MHVCRDHVLGGECVVQSVSMDKADPSGFGPMFDDVGDPRSGQPVIGCSCVKLRMRRCQSAHSLSSLSIAL